MASAEPRQKDITREDAEHFMMLAQQNRAMFADIEIVVPLRVTDGMEAHLSKMLSVWSMVGIQWGPLTDYGGGFIECTRANIAAGFLRDSTRKYLLMIDNDMVPDVWLPYHLARWEKPVVGSVALTTGANGPRLCMSVKDTDGNYRLPDCGPDSRMPRTGLMNVGHVGTGAMMIRRDVLEAFSFKPGDTPFYVNEEIRQRGHSTGVLKRGEDIEFCNQVRAKGFDVFVDLEAHVGHKKPIVLNWPEEQRDPTMTAEEWVVPPKGLLLETR